MCINHSIGRDTCVRPGIKVSIKPRTAQCERGHAEFIAGITCVRPLCVRVCVLAGAVELVIV